MAIVGWTVGVVLTVLGCAVAINFAIKGQAYKSQYSSLPALIQGQISADSATATVPPSPDANATPAPTAP